MEKETDIVIYFKETRDIIAILPNTKLSDTIIVRKEFDAIEVDNTRKYIIGNYNTGELKFQNPNNKILYLDDFR